VAGDAGVTISGARTPAEARLGDITFVVGPEDRAAWRASRASAAFVSGDVGPTDRPLVRVAEPLVAFARIVLRFRAPPPAAHPTARVHPTARLGPGTTVGPHAVVGAGATIGAGTTLHAGVTVGPSCRVGDDAVLHPGVVLYAECVVGNRVVIHARATVGADGFGYRTRDGRHEKVPHLGRVEIGDDVEIGPGATIDRGTFGATRIGGGSKLHGLVMVAHNCRLGRHNVLAAQAGVAGSSETGDHVTLGRRAGVVDHVRLGDRVAVADRAAVIGTLPAGARVAGFPGRPEEEVARYSVELDGVPELVEDLRRIKTHLRPTMS
jgi:UDP-3-O-[3-hydroxymyristoyl] glucosamine N-acyltransferase